METQRTLYFDLWCEIISKLFQKEAETEKRFVQWLTMRNVNREMRRAADLVVKPDAPVILRQVLIQFRSKASEYIIVTLCKLSHGRYQSESNSLLYLSVERGMEELFKLVMCDGVDQQSLVTAIENEQVMVANRLLKEPWIDPSFNSARALQVAAMKGYESLVSLMLSDPRMDTFFASSRHRDQPIRLACQYNKLQILSLLLLDGRSDPTVYNNELVERAAEKGNHEILEMLLNHPKVDPGILDGAPLKWAVHNSDMKAINLLLNHPRSQAPMKLVDYAKTNRCQQVYDLLLKNWEMNDQKDLFVAEE
eukprot:TRINITY_DN8008_c0_g1_i1.p1 TRINITY_DN8008_c0_g1~~TRINITY_DN8008_c0_g1_i1.p1  ORF type:complete len:308 (-),score=54.59 TRINITY_DN8008_c0_g1_i1:13-936(-)